MYTFVELLSVSNHASPTLFYKVRGSDISTPLIAKVYPTRIRNVPLNKWVTIPIWSSIWKTESLRYKRINKIIKHNLTPNIVIYVDHIPKITWKDFTTFPEWRFAYTSLLSKLDYSTNSTIEIEFGAIIMEYVSGISLSKWLIRRSRTSIAQCVFSLIHTIRAMDSIKFTHNDLHINNILMSYNAPAREFTNSAPLLYVSDVDIVQYTQSYRPYIYDMDRAVSSKYPNPSMKYYKHSGNCLTVDSRRDILKFLCGIYLTIDDPSFQQYILDYVFTSTSMGTTLKRRITDMYDRCRFKRSKYTSLLCDPDVLKQGMTSLEQISLAFQTAGKMRGIPISALNPSFNLLHTFPELAKWMHTQHTKYPNISAPVLLKSVVYFLPKYTGRQRTAILCKLNPK